MPVDRKLDRRDFIKLATAGVAAVAMACGQWDKVLAPGVTETATPPPTSAVEGQVIFGIGEFTSGDPSLVGSIRDLLREGFNLQIDDEGAKSIIPFSIKYDTSEFDFVSLPPLENSDLEISFGEKIFMRIDNALVDLDRREVDSDGIRLVTWSFLNLETNKPEPVLWYPALTTEQWEGLTQEQIKDLYAGFAPPTPLELTIPGYSRNLDRVFAISFLGLPEGAFKVRAALRPIELLSPEQLMLSRAPMYYDTAYLKQFTGIKQVDDKMIGTDAAGGEKILAQEMTMLDGHTEMTRVSESGGMRVFIDNDWNIDGAIQVNDNTVRVIKGWLAQALFEGEFKGRFATPEALWSWLIQQDSVALQLPRSESTNGNSWIVVWEEKKLNLQLPMEIILAGSMQEYYALPAELRTGIMDGAAGGSGISGGFFTTGEDGHGILVMVDSVFAEDNPYERIDELMEEYNITLDDIRPNTSQRISIYFLGVFRTLAHADEGVRAYIIASNELLANDPNLEIAFDSISDAFMAQFR